LAQTSSALAASLVHSREYTCRPQVLQTEAPRSLVQKLQDVRDDKIGASDSVEETNSISQPACVCVDAILLLEGGTQNLKQIWLL